MRRFLNIFILSFLFLFVRSPQAVETPYLVLVSFDGFRWDYANRDITPNLERMKQEGVSALSLQPVFPSKTFPSHYSIISGLFPENHGIIYNNFLNPATGERYKVGDSSSVRNSKWYSGEAFWQTARRQGILTASCFWPGSEVDLPYRRPTYFKRYDRHRSYRQRVDDALTWLQLPEEKRPHFITLYFEETDDVGHVYGPDSPQINRAIAHLDTVLGWLFAGLAKLPVARQVNVVVVSDHGMTTVKPGNVVNIPTLLAGIDCRIEGYDQVLFFWPDSGKTEEIYLRLKNAEQHFRVCRRKEIPGFYHFRHHPFISPLVAIADPGWVLQKSKDAGSAKMEKVNKGAHGYDNHFLDMHGIFYALGPAFKTGYRTGTLRSIDVYPLLCKIFGIPPRQNIDGKSERIEFILKAEE